MMNLAKDPFSMFKAPPTREGFLTKLGYNSGKWQQRWFVLQGSELSYASSRGGTSKGQIVLNTSCVVGVVNIAEPVSSDALAPGKSAKQPVPNFAFKVSTPYKSGTRTYYLYASNEEDRQGWVGVISAICQGQQPAQQQCQGQAPDMNALMGLAQQAQQLNANQTPGQAPDMNALMGLAQQAQQLNMGQSQGQQPDLSQMLGMAQQLQQQQGTPQDMSSSLVQQAEAYNQQVAQMAQQQAPDQQGQVAPPPPYTPPTERAEAGDRPAPPPTPASQLPPFPKKEGIQSGNMGMMGMLKMSGQLMGAMKAHKQDPHLSQEDNAVALANKVGAITGAGTHEEQLLEVSKILARDFLPKGLSGLVVTEQPGPGTLGAEFGLKPYDFIFEAEGVPFEGAQQLGASRQQAFAANGQWTIAVYNFQTQQYRDVVIKAPVGKPNAILGISATPVPPPSDEALQQARDAAEAEVFVKGWKKNGAMFVSSGNNYYPLSGPRSDADMNVHVKVWKRAGPGMMVSTNQYFPLYAYQGDPEYFTEGWRSRGGVMISTGADKYVPLPPR